MPALLRALALALTLCGPAFAQTLTPFENPQSSPAKKPPAHKPVEHRHAPAKKHAPVVAAPRHGAPVRHPLRPTSAKPTLKPPPPKPVAKPVPPAVKKPAPPPVPADVGTDTGLHLPRFASLKTDEVNMRAGPGEQYPVLWQYQRRDLPIKIEREFEKWRLVEDMDGIKGWMHEATLTGHRNFVITGTADVTLRAQVNDTAEAVATLKPGVIGRLRACDAASLWCQVQVQSYQGFVRRSDIWGVQEGEAITP
jgi:SH3-like domain-containing protein